MTANSDKQAYKQDFYSWALANAQLMRTGRLAEIDAVHIAEELESMGKSDKRELINRLSVLIAHLLKWQFQPNRRSNSWKYTIEEQRYEILDLLEDSPSLKHELEEKLLNAYRKAVLFAASETGMDKESFPKSAPFSLAQCLNLNFLP